MAIKDALLEFSDGQALTAAAETKASNQIKLPDGYDAWGNAKNGMASESGDVWLNIRCSTAFTMTSSTGTITPKLYGSNTTGGTDNLLLTGPAKAQPSQGDLLWAVPLPANVNYDYLNLTFTLSTAASAGALDAWIGLDHESDPAT
jgi:hypothetical protein